jgi:hypothetical protein
LRKKGQEIRHKITPREWDWKFLVFQWSSLKGRNFNSLWNAP